jgi:hypothetical protein
MVMDCTAVLLGLFVIFYLFLWSVPLLLDYFHQGTYIAFLCECKNAEKYYLCMNRIRSEVSGFHDGDISCGPLGCDVV